MSHKFGGRWTALKLDTLGKYLKAYNKVLSNQPVTRKYADAFAGTGEYQPNGDDDQGDMLPAEEMKGSAQIALEADFHEYFFNDLDTNHVEALRELKAQHPGKTIHVTQYDGNKFIRKFCGHLRPQDRAVLFIDPYSTELNWSSLEMISKTPGIDLWLLFPISALLRMTPRKRSVPEWEAAITRMLGRDDWRREIYVEQPAPAMHDLFGDDTEHEISVQRLDARGLQGYITRLLRDTFPFASDPLELRNSKGPLFLLYFAVTNPSPKAQAIASKIVNDILKKAGRR